MALSIISICALNYKHNEGNKEQIQSEIICIHGIEYYYIVMGYKKSYIVPKLVPMDEHLNIATVVKCGGK